MADDRVVAELEQLQARQPAMVALARLASVAAVVEPSLLRRLRQELEAVVRPSLPGDASHQPWDAGLEADLWCSRLAHVATPSQLTLRPAVLEVLRSQLTQPAHRAAAHRARNLVKNLHAGHSDMLQLEEQIIWATVTSDRQAVGDALNRALATLKADEERAVGLVRWFTQARRRIPASALRHPTGQRLLAAVAMHLDRVIPRELLDADHFPDSVGDLASSTLPSKRIGIVLSTHGIRFTSEDEPDAATITVPDTRPLLVEVTWRDIRFREHTTLARAGDGDAAALADLAGPVVLRTLSGDRFAVRSAEARHIVVAVIGLYSSPEWSADPASIANSLTAAVGDPDITVGVVKDPRDLYGRPEIVVLGRVVDDYSLADFNSHVQRTVTRKRAIGAKAPTFVKAVDVGSRGEPLVKQLKTKLKDSLEVVDVEGEFAFTEAVAALIRRVAQQPTNLYTLDVNDALTLLNSVALAFHVGAFHRDEQEEQDNNYLFDIPADQPDESNIQRQIYEHTRIMCEYIFERPIREFLEGGADPTREPSTQERSLASPAWSPTGNPWGSFADHLEWLVEQFRRFAALLRDRLGAGEVHNGNAVPAAALEAVRIAVGTAALPTGRDELVSYSSSSSSSSSASDEEEERLTVYPVERSELPNLIRALAEPVLAAVTGEQDRRQRIQRPRASSTAPVVNVDPQPDDDSTLWQIEDRSAAQRRFTSTTAPGTLSDMLTAARRLQSELDQPDATPRMSDMSLADIAGPFSHLVPDNFWSQLNQVYEARPDQTPYLQIRSPIDLPWELAVDSSAVHPSAPPFLGRRAAVAVWPSGIPWRAQAPSRVVSFLVAAPGHGDQLREAPGTRRESAMLMSRYGADRVRADLRTLLNVLSSSTDDERVRLLHLAPHSAPLVKGPPDRLALEDGEFLTPRELETSKSSRGLIVFLATTGAAKGLATALLRSGASGVIAPTSAVTAAESTEFALRFYRGALDEGVPIAEVLRSLRCEEGPIGRTALFYRFFGHWSTSLLWQPAGLPA